MNENHEFPKLAQSKLFVVKNEYWK